MSDAASPAKRSHECHSCGRTSVLPYLDWRGRCPACRPPRIGWALAGIICTFLPLGAAMVVGGDIEPGAKVVAFLALWPLALVNAVIHESAHALVAWLLGWRVHAVAIGAGDPWARLRLGRVQLLINRRPFVAAGHCQASPEIAVPSRRAIALFAGAPLYFHAVAAAVALPFVSGESLDGVLAAMFVTSNLISIPWNAWPRDIPHRGPFVMTDGKHLLELWRAPEAALARWREAVEWSRYQARLLDGGPDAVIDSAEEILARDPGNSHAAACLALAAHGSGRPERALSHVAPYARMIEDMRPRKVRALADRDLAARGLFRGQELEEYMRGSLLVALDRLDETLAISERGVEAAKCEETRALWQACVALALLMMGRDLDRAEEAARWAYERLPWVPFVEAAWGMARIERGDPKGGLAIFDRVARIDPKGQTLGLRAGWTVAANAALGQPDGTLPAVLQAPNAWPACRRRAERALVRPPACPPKPP